jgi:glyoxylase-like metal-dependent hydrolase (beta-lactamase superfamily II)
MDHINFPKDQVVPMEVITPDIRGLRIVFVNVFGVAHADGSWTLIDAGLPYSETLIRHWAEKEFQGAPNAILLTHGHFDHVSAAGQLAAHWNVSVYAHPDERPYLTGEQEYPPPNFAAGGGLMSLLSPLLPRRPVNLGQRLRLLESADSEVLDVMPGWQILHTPGHTPGHISFFREQDGTLLPGDAFCTTKPESFFEAAIAQKPELHGPPAYFTSDWRSARRSVERLATLRPQIVAPGHGRPIAGESVAPTLQRLAAQFDEVAVPENRSNPAA